MGALTVRPATGADWPAIHPIFTTVTAAGETFGYPRDLDEAAARAMWMAAPPAQTFVAVDDDGTVVGTARAGANWGGPAAHMATGSFMVDPARARRGTGRALVEHVLAWARAEGFAAMVFNAVVETNAPAVALWRSAGFEILTTIPEAFEHPAHGRVGLHVMHRRL